VVSKINYTLLDHVEHLTLVTGASHGVGNSLNNNIEGNDQANTLDGLDGNDQLDVGLGNSDSMTANSVLFATVSISASQSMTHADFILV
jgi:Ca2+-binding RTX toxin-like protein